MPYYLRGSYYIIFPWYSHRISTPRHFSPTNQLAPFQCVAVAPLGPLGPLGPYHSSSKGSARKAILIWRFGTYNMDQYGSIWAYFMKSQLAVTGSLGSINKNPPRPDLIFLNLGSTLDCRLPASVVNLIRCWAVRRHPNPKQQQDHWRLLSDGNLIRPFLVKDSRWTSKDFAHMYSHQILYIYFF